MFEGILGIKKPTFGLDIGYETLKVVQVKGRNQGTRLLGASEMTIPAGMLNKGGVRDKKKLAEAIIQAVGQAKPHRISATIVSSALPESLVFTKSLDLPKMSPSDLNKNIPNQATEFFPIPPQDTYMDWQIVGQYPANNTMEVLVVAAPKVLVESLVETVKMAGLELMGLETKPSSLARALIAPSDNEATIILDIGAKISGLTCFDQQTIKLTSTVAVGGDEIKTDFETATKALATEIMHLIKYYQNRIGQAQVFTKIVLAGGGANIKNIPETLTEETKIKTFVGTPWTNIKTYDPRFATALGLAMKDIND